MTVWAVSCITTPLKHFSLSLYIHGTKPILRFLSSSKLEVFLQHYTLHQRCHPLGFLPRSWVFRSNLGFLGFVWHSLRFFLRFFQTAWVFLGFFIFYRKIHLFQCFSGWSKELAVDLGPKTVENSKTRVQIWKSELMTKKGRQEFWQVKCSFFRKKLGFLEEK